MEAALGLFALAAAGFSVALVIWIAGRVWIRAKELDRSAPQPTDQRTLSDLAAALANIDARLTYLQQSTDVTAVEVERLAEGQRFAARALVPGHVVPSDVTSTH